MAGPQQGVEQSGPHLGPSYKIPTDEVYRLSAALLAERASDVPDKHRFVAVEVGGDSAYANVGRYIERVVFDATFEGNDADMLSEEYGPFEKASRFFISIDRETKQPTGVLRIIQNSPSGLKTLNDAEGQPFFVDKDDVMEKHSIDSLDEAWDVGTVAVLPEFRSGEGAVSVQLYRAMYLSAVEHGIKHLVSIIDERAHKSITEYLGVPFIPLAGSKPGEYLGSERSQAVYGYVPDFQEKMNKHMRTAKGLLARRALQRLVRGTEDDSIVFDPLL